MLLRQRFVTHGGPETVPIDTTELPIGRALKVERTVAGVSLTAVALGVGISAGQLSHIEKGDRSVSAELVERIRAFIAAEGHQDEAVAL